MNKNECNTFGDSKVSISLTRFSLYQFGVNKEHLFTEHCNQGIFINNTHVPTNKEYSLIIYMYQPTRNIH